MVKRFYKTVLLALCDLFLANLGVFAALVICCIPELSDLKGFLASFFIGVPLLCVSVLIAFIVMHLYRVIWKYADTFDLLRLGVGLAISFVVYVGLHHLSIRLFGSVGDDSIGPLPIASYVLGGLFALFMITAIRVLMRVYKRDKTEPGLDEGEIVRVMVIGGGNAGALLLRDLHQNVDFKHFRAVCVIDDSPEKLGKMVYGVRIVGGCDTIVDNAKKFNVDEIVFAIPTADPERRAEVLKICTDTGCVVKTLPPLAKMLEAGNDLSSTGVHGALRSVNVEDLLGREPIKVDLESILDYIKNKTVLVTGGGGSIGSELCRQIASHDPKRLIIFDIYENNAYDIQNELKRKYPDLELETLIGSVREERRLDEIFEKYRPDIVYHAAAHKHVPLMEDSPKEAVKNNVFGTYNVARAADKYGVKRFVMISTDKAVNPTNVMGATKRVCEMIVQTMNKKSKTMLLFFPFPYLKDL